MVPNTSMVLYLLKREAYVLQEIGNMLTECSASDPVLKVLGLKPTATMLCI